MNIHIVGAGAIGLLYGGYLAKAGEEITFWTRKEAQRKLLLEQGIYIEEADGNTVRIEAGHWTARVLKQSECDEHSAAQREAPEWILIAVKQSHLEEEMISALSHIAGPDTRIACLQNGIGHIDKISRRLDGRPVFTIITTEGSTRLADNGVRRAGLGESRLGISKVQASSSLDALHDKATETLLNTLRKAGFPTFLSNDIDKDIYRKLLINSVINPLTAILRVPNGDLLVSEERMTMVRMLCEEAERAYKACGISLDDDAFELVASVCRSTSTNTSSMLGDVLHHRATEIDAINGQLVGLAESVGIDLPMHRMLWLLVKSLHA